MTRCTVYLTLAACVMAVPLARAQEPDLALQYQSASAADSGGGSPQAVEVILKASGVANRNGRVTWPLGFRLLRADEPLQELEAQLQLAAEQVTAGGANPQLLDEIGSNVEALRRLLLADKERRFSMPLATYEDAERFLQKLKSAPKVLAVSAPAASPAQPPG